MQFVTLQLESCNFSMDCSFLKPVLLTGVCGSTVGQHEDETELIQKTDDQVRFQQSLMVCSTLPTVPVFLSQPDVEQVIHAFISLLLYYCNCI